MVVRREKKSRSFRGSHTHGWGAKKKHRGAGSKGGKGFAGSLGANKFYVQMNFPGHIGKKGFHRPVKTKEEINGINILNLATMDGKEFDLAEMGFNKLLGKGKISKAVTVKVKYASEQAIAKIEGAGGKVVLG